MCQKLRSPAGTTAENIFFIWWPPDNMWWPPDSDVVATTSLSGGHQIAMYVVFFVLLV